MIYLPEYFILTFSLFIHIDEFKSQVFRIRKYLFRISGIVILKYGFGSGRPINYGSGRIRILLGHIVAIEKYVVK